MNQKLLVQLAVAVAANGTTERKFRNAVLIKLSEIQTTVTHVHGAQLAEMCRKDRATEAQQETFFREVQERVSAASEQAGLKMIRYIYGETEAEVERHDKRRKWWGWEI